MGGQSGLLELSVISWMSAFEGCPLSGVPLYKHQILRSGVESGGVKPVVVVCR